MPRIQPVERDTATGTTRELLDGINAKFGTVPNLLGTMAQSPAALNAYLGLGEALAGGSLSGKLREQVAIAIAGANSCEYCASAHTTIGAGLGIDAGEAAANLRGESGDPKAQAAIEFATAVVERRGWVSDEQFNAVREAGFSDGEISELIAVVALNTLTNYFNHIAQTEVDFPRVEVGAPAGA